MRYSNTTRVACESAPTARSGPRRLSSEPRLKLVHYPEPWRRFLAHARLAGRLEQFGHDARPHCGRNGVDVGPRPRARTGGRFPKIPRATGGWRTCSDHPAPPPPPPARPGPVAIARPRSSCFWCRRNQGSNTVGASPALPCAATSPSAAFPPQQGSIFSARPGVVPQLDLRVPRRHDQRRDRRPGRRAKLPKHASTAAGRRRCRSASPRPTIARARPFPDRP